LIELRVTWVLADLAEDVHETCENSFVGWCQALASDNDDSHSTWVSASASRGSATALTLHEVVVLGNLLWSTSLFDVGEQGHEDVLGKWTDIRLCESKPSAFH
jgi:hypothetical protein